MTDASCLVEIEVQVSRDVKLKFTTEVSGSDNKEVIRRVFDYVDLILEVWGEREK